MKKIILLFVMTQMPLSSTFALGKNKVIYGDDNRSLIQDLSNNYSKIKKLASGIGAFVLNSDIRTKNKITTIIESFKQEELDMCPDEKYAKFPAMSYCTGFLIGEKYMLTAGHCVDQSLCPEMSVVFGYHQTKVSAGVLKFKSKNIYGCKKVIKHVRDDNTGIDFALIQLKRKVKNRAILKLSKRRPKKGEQISMIGFPSNLPQMYTDHARIFELGKNTFKSNLDSFAGNSGSPVFNKIGKVIGILVAGSTDTYYDSQNKCQRTKVCLSTNSGDCLGEKSLYTYTFLTDLIKKL